MLPIPGPGGQNSNKKQNMILSLIGKDFTNMYYAIN